MWVSLISGGVEFETGTLDCFAISKALFLIVVTLFE